MSAERRLYDDITYELLGFADNWTDVDLMRDSHGFRPVRGGSVLIGRPAMTSFARVPLIGC